MSISEIDTLLIHDNSFTKENSFYTKDDIVLKVENDCISFIEFFDEEYGQRVSFGRETMVFSGLQHLSIEKFINLLSIMGVYVDGKRIARD